MPTTTHEIQLVNELAARRDHLIAAVATKITRDGAGQAQVQPEVAELIVIERILTLVANL